MDHDSIRDALGAFALNAVDSEESIIVSNHVASCEPCRSELDQHLEVASLLSATERSGPAELWLSIADEIHAPASPAPSAQVIPLRRRWFQPMAVAAAFVLLAGAAVVQSVRLGDVRSDLSAERATVADLNDRLAAPAMESAAADAMIDPNARTVALSAADSEAAAIIVLMPDGTGYLAEHSLKPLPTDRTYQLWAIVGGKVISAGILGSDPGVTPFHIDVAGFEGFAITEEVVGGVEASENAPVVVGLAA